jgi:hypothetical protein
MRQTRIWPLFVVACFLAGGCRKVEFKEFSSPEGRFKVEFPGTPKKTNQQAAGIKMTTYTVEEKNGAYVVAFADAPIPSGETEAQLRKRLDGARDGMVGNVGGKLTSESDLTLKDKYPGREVKADIPSKKGALRARVYIVDGRLYQVMVIGTSSWITSAEATRFLDSFALTE